MSGLGQHIEYAQNFIAQVDAQHTRDKEKAGLTDADLEAKVQEIDMRDGRLDGQDLTQTVPLTCRQCGRTILSGQSQCSWCGAQAEGGPFTHAR